MDECLNSENLACEVDLMWYRMARENHDTFLRIITVLHNHYGAKIHLQIVT